MSLDYMISIETMTDKDWAELKKIAVQIYDSRQFGTDQTKCAVAAFVLWLMHQPEDFMLGQEVESKEMH